MTHFMRTSAPTVLLLGDAPELREWLIAAGVSVGNSLTDSFDVAVIATSDAGTVTRRLRTHPDTDRVPVLWVVPEHTSLLTGLESGADVVLTQPLESAVFVAQVRAMIRRAETVAELAERIADSRRLNAELTAAYADAERGLELARRVRKSLLPDRLPDVAGVRVSVHSRPRAQVGGSLYDATLLGDHHIGFWVAAPGGSAQIAGLLGIVVKTAIGSVLGRADHDVSPKLVLDRVNRELLGLQLDPAPLVGLAFGVLDTRSGAIAVSRGGLPPPVHVPDNGPAVAWFGPGPFLGAFDADFPAQLGTLRPAEKLILRTGIAVADSDPIPTASVRHRSLSGANFADAVARDASLLSPNEDEFTLLVVERLPEPSADLLPPTLAE